MNYQSKLKSEIISVLDDLTESKQDWNATFIAQLVCDNHKHELVNANALFTSTFKRN